MTNAFEDALLKTVRKRIEKRIAEVSDHVLTGRIAKGSYRQHTAELKGLRFAIEQMDKAEQELMRRAA